MNIGHSFATNYELLGKALKNIKSEKDLGVWVSDDLKPNLQCHEAATKAFRVLATIRKHFTHINKDGFIILYNTYILSLIWNIVFKPGPLILLRILLVWKEFKEKLPKW